MCQLYRKADYDFSNFFVSRCLANVRDCEDEEKYICLSCHKDFKKQKITTLCCHIMVDIQI